MKLSKGSTLVPRFFFPALLFALLLAVSQACGGEPQTEGMADATELPPADLLLTNARVYTLD